VDNRPHGATLNSKLFLAYNSDVNRLHVWDGTSVRRVGIAASAAPTAADSGGAGTYSGTRYYKIQWKIINGSDTVATSELSSALMFTPSGANLNVTVTKPTTPDSATHWAVFASADNVSFYKLSSDTAVAATTYVDDDAITTYSNGTIAPSVGLYVPPPAAKYLLATDNRLFMAGCWETTATSTQTATRNSRVWFTAVLGALDNTGEDEAIRQTIDTKHWIDVGENDGDGIVGLGGPMNGAVYVFKERSVWQLSPTGNTDNPYRADRVTDAVGTTGQSAICMGEDGSGQSALYFVSPNGPKRIVFGVIEDVGQDWRDPENSQWGGNRPALVCWDINRRLLVLAQSGTNKFYTFQPQFEERRRDGVRFGWARHACLYATTSIRALVSYEVSNQLTPYFAGAVTVTGVTTPFVASWSGITRNDFASTNMAPVVVSPIYQPGGLLTRVGFGHAVLEWDYPGAATAPSVSVASVIGGPLAVIGTVTGTATNSTYSESVIQEKMESIQLSDVFGLQITVTWDATVDGSERPRIHGVTLPVSAQEGA
jgi:hypothetical protein